MNTIHLRAIFRDEPRFVGVFASDRVPKKKMIEAKNLVGLIANLDPISKPGSHWICMIVTPREDRTRPPLLEYFDSYGRPPPPSFTGLTKSFDVVYNKRRLQSYYTATCGQFCVYTLWNRFRGKTFLSIIKSLTKSPDPDGRVRSFVRKRFWRVTDHAGTCSGSSGGGGSRGKVQCCRDFCPRPPCKK